ncbi:hypothetical protein JCM8547_005815 [Rhodosporidiobolus lusitaniae]
MTSLPSSFLPSATWTYEEGELDYGEDDLVFPSVFPPSSPSSFEPALRFDGREGRVVDSPEPRLSSSARTLEGGGVVEEASREDWEQGEQEEKAVRRSSQWTLIRNQLSSEKTRTRVRRVRYSLLYRHRLPQYGPPPFPPSSSSFLPSGPPSFPPFSHIPSKLPLGLGLNLPFNAVGGGIGIDPNVAAVAMQMGLSLLSAAGGMAGMANEVPAQTQGTGVGVPPLQGGWGGMGGNRGGGKEGQWMGGSDPRCVSSSHPHHQQQQQGQQQPRRSSASHRMKQEGARGGNGALLRDRIGGRGRPY